MKSLHDITAPILARLDAQRRCMDATTDELQRLRDDCEATIDRLKSKPTPQAEKAAS
jgi:hypothetical protein